MHYHPGERCIINGNMFGRGIMFFSASEEGRRPIEGGLFPMRRILFVNAPISWVSWVVRMMGGAMVPVDFTDNIADSNF